jgi:hypothetical protein
MIPAHQAKQRFGRKYGDMMINERSSRDIHARCGAVQENRIEKILPGKKARRAPSIG